MIDDNPFEASTPAAVPGMSPEALVSWPAPLPFFEPPMVMDPVSNLDFLPVDDAFALEMRAETIEQLAGGDALRRGESERIEAGRSQTNADLVAGRDRVRVQDTLHEHTGHALAEQAAHLHTTVDGALDLHAASEDTVLLAGHMRDLWDGGAAIVAAMTDDTVAGGGIRVTTPLDLWVHGLMGVEERIGTCTADAVLMESSAMHYEREYGPGVHAAGLAVYTGSLHQSSRSTFRPLMRVSSGVRNLIDGRGGEGAGGGRAPGASPPPVPAAGGAGTRAASETLSTATGAGAGGTAQAGGMAGVRSQDLTGIHRGDEVAALALGTNVVGTSGDLTELRRGTDTAGQLAALRDAMRGGEAGTQGEVTSVSRVSKPDDPASVHEASAADIVVDIRSGATGPGMDAPVSHCAVSPQRPPPGVKLGLPGGGGDPVRPASSDLESWSSIYTRLHEEYSRHRSNSNWIATRAFRDAISSINAKLIEAYVELGGSIDDLKRNPLDGAEEDADLEYVEFGWSIGRGAYGPGIGDVEFGWGIDDLERDPWGETVGKGAYRALRNSARQADSAGNIDRASTIERFLASIDRLTVELTDELRARTGEFNRACVEASRIRPLDPRIDAQKLADWIEEQLKAGERRRGDAVSSLDLATPWEEYQEDYFLWWMQRKLAEGLDPRVASYNNILHSAEFGDIGFVEAAKSLHVRLLEVMADPSMHRSVAKGSEAGGAIPPPFRPVDSGAAGRLGEIPRIPGPSSSATAGTDAGDLGRGMLDQPVVGPADEAHPGTAAPRSGDARAMATSQLGAESTFWLRPVDPVPAPGTVRFDAGLQRAGQQPPHSGEAAFGATAVHPPFVPTPHDMLDPSHLTYAFSSSQDAFEVERALIAGRLPTEIDLSDLMSKFPGLDSSTEIEALLESGRLPTPAIDSIIERLRAVEGRRGHIQYIQQLEAVKRSIDRVLTHAYGYRADAQWLATVDRFLKSGSVAQAVGVEPVSVASRGEDIVGGAQTSLRPVRVESAAAPDPTAGGAGELSPGALSPAHDRWGLPWSEVGSSPGELSPGALSPVQDPRSPRPQVRFGATEVVRFDPESPAGSVSAGRSGIPVSAPEGWQGDETPGFGRLASGSGELPLSVRESIVHRLIAGEAISALPRSELIRRYERAIRAATIASPAPRARTAAALFEDLRRLFTAARESPACAALEDIDWAAIVLMLRLLDAPGL